MESPALMCSTSIIHLPLLRPQSTKRRIGLRREQSRRTRGRIMAEKKWAEDGSYDGRLVDESMIVLRRRIHEMKMVERNYEPPADWADWEKRYYTYYDSDVCQAVGLLQELLMNTRPGVAIGMAAMVTLSVPTSMFFIVFHLVELAKGILPLPFT